MTRLEFWGDDGRISDAIRQLLQTRPRELVIPKWILSAVKAAIRAKRLPTSPFKLTTARDALEHALTGLDRTWADHPGRLKIDGRELLIAEPYAPRIKAEMLNGLEAFVSLVGGRYLFTANSGHYPGQTVRIIVAQTTDALDRFFKHEALPDAVVRQSKFFRGS